MQFVQNMANYMLRPFSSGGEKDRKIKKETLRKSRSILDIGGGDFDNSSIITNLSSVSSLTSPCSPSKRLHKQTQNTQTLVKSLAYEIAEAKEDLRFLNEHISSAEESFPKRWDTFRSSKNACKEYNDALSVEMIKWKRKNERFDEELKVLERRIESWQSVIDEAKAAQIQEVDFND